MLLLIWSKFPITALSTPRIKGRSAETRPVEETTHFFIRLRRTTAYVILRGRRYTLALCRVRAGEKIDMVLKSLMRTITTLGISLLLIDRGFYSGSFGI